MKNYACQEKIIAFSADVKVRTKQLNPQDVNIIHSSVVFNEVFIIISNDKIEKQKENYLYFLFFMCCVVTTISSIK